MHFNVKRKKVPGRSGGGVQLGKVAAWQKGGVDPSEKRRELPRLLLGVRGAIACPGGETPQRRGGWGVVRRKRKNRGGLEEKGESFPTKDGGVFQGLLKKKVTHNGKWGAKGGTTHVEKTEMEFRWARKRPWKYLIEKKKRVYKPQKVRSNTEKRE